MKKLIAIFLLSMIPTIVFADEYERNPDRFPSLGFSVGLEGLGGNSDATGGLGSQDTSIGRIDLGADMRIPVSNSWTLYGALDLIGERIKSDATSSLAGFDNSLGGIAIRAGARYYFNGQ